VLAHCVNRFSSKPNRIADQKNTNKLFLIENSAQVQRIFDNPSLMNSLKRSTAFCKIKKWQIFLRLYNFVGLSIVPKEGPWALLHMPSDRPTHLQRNMSEPAATIQHHE
jgi:hypothetical protein